MKLKAVAFVMVFMMLSSVTAWAAVTKTQVAELYVATFNRAPDATGLDYWVNDSFNGNPDIDLIAMSFFDQPETQALYPADTTDEDFVIAIYDNLFNRVLDPDDEGLAYWTGENGLGGGMHRSVMIQAVKNGATGTDAEIIANKAEVALYYADELGLGGTDFLLADITGDRATVGNAKQAINAIAGITPASLEDEIVNYMAMISSAGELSPMVEELGILFDAVLNEDSPVVTITPSLENIDISNLPQAINITANFGNGYTPEGTSGVYTGLTVIDITGLSFTQAGISATASMTATNVMRDGVLVLHGSMTMGIHAALTDPMSLTANVSFSNLTSLDSRINGGISLNIPAVTGDGQLVEPITITLDQLTTQDYQMNGTVTMTQAAPDMFDAAFNLTTGKGPVAGVLRVQMDVGGNPDLTIVSTPSGPLTVEDATLEINDVSINAEVCPELPVSGNIVVTRGAETNTVNFSNCAYTVD